MKTKFPIVLFALFLIPSSALAADVEAGKALFTQICSYCHNSNYDDKFGPGLAGVLDRRDAIWLDEFLKNPREMIGKDQDAKDLSQSYPMAMPTLPDMQDEKKRADIIAYMATLE